jgi:ABC-type nickel/cobalt efflux system permease component RcnA
VNGAFAALALAAASVGALHSIAPDHWLPFAALGRAQRWSRRRTLLITLVCGIGHVTVSVALGLFALLLGLEVLDVFGKRLEAIAGLLLIGFGLAYGAWGLRRAMRRKLHESAHEHEHEHGHAHSHEHGSHSHHGHRHDHGLGLAHEHAHSHVAPRRTAFTLFLLFSADPCVAVMPLMLAAAPLGAWRTAGVVLAYEAATLGAMLIFVALAHAGATRLRAPWVDRWGDGAAGAVIAAVGVAMAVLGI